MASFALECDQAREGHFVGGFRTCCPHSHDVGLSSKESFAFLEQCWTDQWLCMRAEWIQVEEEVSCADMEGADTFLL